MTPKEKALELLNKFSVHTKAFNDNSGWIIDVNSTKECALIAVDEIIDTLLYEYHYDYYWDKKLGYYLSFEEYWTEVKEELEKL
jgi:hypothetical protein